VRHGVLAVALGRNDNVDLGGRQFLMNGVRVMALVGQQRFDLVGEHAHQRREALDVVRLSTRQDETERAAFGIATGAAVC